MTTDRLTAAQITAENYRTARRVAAQHQRRGEHQLARWADNRAKAARAEYVRLTGGIGGLD